MPLACHRHRTKVLLWILLPLIFISNRLKISVSIFAYAMAEWKQKCVHVSMNVDSAFSYIDWQSIRFCLFKNRNNRLESANFYAANDVTNILFYIFHFPSCFHVIWLICENYSITLYMHIYYKQFPVGLPSDCRLAKLIAATPMWHTDLICSDIAMRNCNRSINVINLWDFWKKKKSERR